MWGWSQERIVDGDAEQKEYSIECAVGITNAAWLMQWVKAEGKNEPNIQVMIDQPGLTIVEVGFSDELTEKHGIEAVFLYASLDDAPVYVGTSLEAIALLQKGASDPLANTERYKVAMQGLSTKGIAFGYRRGIAESDWNLLRSVLEENQETIDFPLPDFLVDLFQSISEHPQGWVLTAEKMV